jgi:ABC-type glycerol-3-phosphate transport system permease component
MMELEITKNKIKASMAERIGYIILYAIAAGIALLCLYPFLQVLISSFADEVTLTREGYKLFPSKLSLDAWKTLFANDRIGRAYILTIGITVVGTIVCVLITAMAAYALSGKKLKYRNFFNFIYYLTMLFSGGLIPYYIVVSNYLHLTDNLLVYILPFSFNVWNMFLLRNFFNEIPEEIIESAYLEGAGEWCTAFRIVLPLSLPALATVSLFTAVSFWNEWMTSLLFINNPDFYTLQYIIVQMVNSISAASDLGASGLPTGVLSVPSNALRLATAIATIGPIILLYPFLQKYFVAGLRVGGVKG